MFAVFLALCPLQDQPPVVPIARPGRDGRGRDPWAFRCIFEDRTRMLLIAPSPDFWMAFNPETCAMHKVWEGKVDFHGKVWDFSQDNSKADGRIFFAAPSEMWRLPDGQGTPLGWTMTGIKAEKSGWSFPSTSANIVSAPFDASGWHRVFLAFDETSRKGRIHIEVKDESGEQRPQWFESATSVDSDSSWQWNFKRIERPGKALVVTASSTVPGKMMRNFRMYGDRSAWLDKAGRPLTVIWGGYEFVHDTKSLDVFYKVRLDSGSLVTIHERPDVDRSGWHETYVVDGLPEGEILTLRREGLSKSVKVGGQLKFSNDRWMFKTNGDFEVTFDTSGGSL